jgi:hypothetical protein
MGCSVTGRDRRCTGAGGGRQGSALQQGLQAWGGVVEKGGGVPVFIPSTGYKQPPNGNWAGGVDRAVGHAGGPRPSGRDPGEQWSIHHGDPLNAVRAGAAAYHGTAGVCAHGATARGPRPVGKRWPMASPPGIHGCLGVKWVCLSHFATSPLSEAVCAWLWALNVCRVQSANSLAVRNSATRHSPGHCRLRVLGRGQAVLRLGTGRNRPASAVPALDLSLSQQHRIAFCKVPHAACAMPENRPSQPGDDYKPETIHPLITSQRAGRNSPSASPLVLWCTAAAPPAPELRRARALTCPAAPASLTSFQNATVACRASVSRVLTSGWPPVSSPRNGHHGLHPCHAEGAEERVCRVARTPPVPGVPAGSAPPRACGGARRRRRRRNAALP